MELLFFFCRFVNIVLSLGIVFGWLRVVWNALVDGCFLLLDLIYEAVCDVAL